MNEYIAICPKCVEPRFMSNSLSSMKDQVKRVVVRCRKCDIPAEQYDVYKYTGKLSRKEVIA